MPLDFPTSPVDGQVYENYQWDDTAGVWNLVPSLVQARYVISATAPLSPENGDAWFDSTDGVTYIYYDDGDSAQWVQTGDPALGYLRLDELADTNIVSPAADEVLSYDGTDWVNVPLAGGFTASSTITATNASWPVPALASPIVKVTVIGAGGGGGGGQRGTGGGVTSGGAGGTTTFNAGGAGSPSASGGNGGNGVTAQGPVATAGLAAGNSGGGGGITGVLTSNGMTIGGSGAGGQITVAYLNLTGISTVNITIGLGGTGGGSSADASGGRAGGRGEVIVEYIAA